MVGFLSAVWILMPENKSNWQFLAVQHLPNIQKLSYFSHFFPCFLFLKNLQVFSKIHSKQQQPTHKYSLKLHPLKDQMGKTNLEWNLQLLAYKPRKHLEFPAYQSLFLSDSDTRWPVKLTWHIALQHKPQHLPLSLKGGREKCFWQAGA